VLQIKYLTQVSTGHPHEGSSYPAQKVLQCAWHRLEHTKSRLQELDRIRQAGLTPAQKQQLLAAQQASKQQQQQQQQQQVKAWGQFLKGFSRLQEKFMPS
jgi:mediator of RNA polymerase II transcription subunit 11